VQIGELASVPRSGPATVVRKNSQGKEPFCLRSLTRPSPENPIEVSACNSETTYLSSKYSLSKVLYPNPAAGRRECQKLATRSSKSHALDDPDLQPLPARRYLRASSDAALDERPSSLRQKLWTQTSEYSYLNGERVPKIHGFM
jgi:hypothetical protein